MKEKYAILVAIALLAIFFYIGEFVLDKHDSFEDYIEWCGEEVIKNTIVYEMNFADTIKQVSKEGYLLSWYIQYMGYEEASFDSVLEYYKHRDNISAKPMLKKTKEARCEPTIEGYQQWKKGK